MSTTLQGDGINDELFFYLWAKDELNFGPNIRVPDTVIYKFGQPVHWYFTSNANGKIKKKHRQNLVNIRIEEAFTKYELGSDIVAYYISLPTGLDGKISEETRVEYFDRKGLHDFLYNRWKESNGILQRFIEPKGTQNSIIRSIWSPKVCLLERRSNNRHIFDKRYGFYERAVTYEGPEYHSIATPLRGSILPTQIQSICEDIVSHISEVTFQKQRIGRMVLNFKVDPKDHVYLLWSSSIRLEGHQSWADFNPRKVDLKKNCLNIEPIVKLPRNIILNDNPNHTFENPAPAKMLDCISCATKQPIDCIHEIPYKTIMLHYEQLIWLLTADPQKHNGTVEWPPDPEVIEAAGGVGFGCLSWMNSKPEEDPLKENQLTINDVAIPPIIRHLHPKMDASSYKKYRKDPLFLYKNAMVCENCYLVYAEFANTAFHMKPMVKMACTNQVLASLFSSQTKAAKRQKDTLWAPVGSAHNVGDRKSKKIQDSMQNKGLHEGNNNKSEEAPIEMPYIPPAITNKAQADLRYGEALAGSQHRQDASAAKKKRAESSNSNSNQTDDLMQPTEVITFKNGQPDQESLDAIERMIKRREDEFFRDVVKSKSVKKDHPLAHIINAQNKMNNVNKIQLSDSDFSGVSGNSSAKLGQLFAGYDEQITFKEYRKKNNAQKKGKKGVTGAGDDEKPFTHYQTESAVQHREFLLRTLKEVQEQLNSPGDLTESIIAALDYGDKLKPKPEGWEQAMLEKEAQEANATIELEDKNKIEAEDEDDIPNDYVTLLPQLIFKTSDISSGDKEVENISCVEEEIVADGPSQLVYDVTYKDVNNGNSFKVIVADKDVFLDDGTLRSMPISDKKLLAEGLVESFKIIGNEEDGMSAVLDMS